MCFPIVTLVCIYKSYQTDSRPASSVWMSVSLVPGHVSVVACSAPSASSLFPFTKSLLLRDTTTTSELWLRPHSTHIFCSRCFIFLTTGISSPCPDVPPQQVPLQRRSAGGAVTGLTVTREDCDWFKKNKQTNNIGEPWLESNSSK